MKTRLAAATALLVGTQAVAAYAGVDVGINIGGPPPVVVAPPPPPVVIRTAPRFIFSPALGFYVSVEAPYDMVYLRDSYYLYNGGYWYRSPYYGGPWVAVESRRLPRGLRQHRFEDIRHHRDQEYRRYEHDRDHYRGRWHNPREARREERHEHREMH